MRSSITIILWLLGSLVSGVPHASAASLADLMLSHGAIVETDGRFQNFSATLTASSPLPAGCCAVSDLSAIDVEPTTIPGGPALTVTGLHISGQTASSNSPPTIGLVLSLAYDVILQVTPPVSQDFHFFAMQEFGAGQPDDPTHSGTLQLLLNAFSPGHQFLGVVTTQTMGTLPTGVVSTLLPGTASMLHVQDTITLSAFPACGPANTGSGCSYGFGETATAFFGIINTNTVPEPHTIVLLSVGLIGLYAARVITGPARR